MADGGTKEPDPNNDDEKDIATIRLALDNGISLIDTAQNYDNDKAEELVDRAIKGRAFPICRFALTKSVFR